MTENNLNLLLEEKKQRIKEMCEYNRRLDRTVMLYITAIYSAIGLRASGKFDLSILKDEPVFTLIAFLFIFLNFCVIIHGISQSAWSMSLAKYVHTEINDEIRKIISSRCKKVPTSPFNWDNWTNDIKGLANQTRDIVIMLWVLLVLFISHFSLHLVDVKSYYNNHLLTTLLISSSLYLLQAYIIYVGLQEVYLTSRYHHKSSTIKFPKIIYSFISLGISSILIGFNIFFLISLS